MKKAFKFNLPGQRSFDLRLSYPSFKKEGLGSLFSILDWGVFLTCFVFLSLLFIPGYFGIVDYSEDGYLRWIYSFIVILFGIQLVRFLLGGISYYPKTYFDIPVLVFVAAIVISTLFSGSEFNLVTGEDNLKILSGFAHVAFLLFYYTIISESLVSKSKSKIIFFFFFSLLGFYIFNFGARYQDAAVLFIFPSLLFFFELFLGRNVLLKIVAFMNLILILLNIKFNYFSVSFSFLLSLIFTAIMYFIFNAKTVGPIFDSFIGDVVKNIRFKNLQLVKFLKSQGRLALFVLSYLGVFAFSIVKTVQYYTVGEMKDVVSSFNRSFNKMETVREWIFGTGLARATDSLYSDILSNFGIIGLAGLVILIVTVFYAFIKLLSSPKLKGEVITYGIFSLFTSLVVLGFFESFTPFTYLLFWISITIVGVMASLNFLDQKIITDKLVRFNKSKYKEVFKEIRAILIIVVVTAVFLLLAWLKQVL